MNKISLLTFIVLLIVSCSFTKKNNSFNESWIKNTNGFDMLIKQFSYNIENIWGLNEVLIAGPKDYVKYTDAYQTRSHINFDKGLITIETISKKDPITHLRQAIIKTLLVSDEPNFLDLYSDSDEIKIPNKEPFLYEQVVDQIGRPIRWSRSAVDFANYLLRNHLKKRNNGLRIIYGITINLIQKHLNKRAHKYMNVIRKASHKYNIDESLILAIIQTESSFNPYAVSRSDALGLMQVVQHTAGKDVFQARGKPGFPSRNYLFDPVNNIDIGTAYLSILNDVYLSSINNPLSRRYAVIAAYNGGAESVLRFFSSKKEDATNIINGMSPSDVYRTLITCHPSSELRRYLHKVNITQKIYNRK